MKKIFSFLLISVSLNSYSQWFQLPNSPFTPGRFIDIYFININTGWTMTGSGAIFKTTNGGISWDIMDSITNSPSLRSITALDESNIYIGTLNSQRVLFKSTNGGQSWKEVKNIPSPQPFGICGLYNITGKYVFGCGTYYGGKDAMISHFLKSDDSGNTWTTKIMSDYASTLIDCYFINKDSGFAVGGIGRFPNLTKSVVLSTSDGGETWINRFTGPRLQEWCWKISFPNRNNGFISLERYLLSGSYFLKTSNGGNSWQDLSFPNVNEQGVGFINENTGWIGGAGNSTYGTTDGGLSWFNSNIGLNINRFRFFGDSVAYASGQYILKYDNTVGVTQISSIIPNDFKLYQNYPNPFNPSTVIKYEVSHGSNVLLKVYDSSGKEIATLVNARKGTGVYEIKMDGEKLSGGIYFYKLDTENFSETKVMVLIK